jgi:hypothetical protein
MDHPVKPNDIAEGELTISIRPDKMRADIENPTTGKVVQKFRLFRQTFEWPAILRLGPSKVEMDNQGPATYTFEVQERETLNGHW